MIKFLIKIRRKDLQKPLNKQIIFDLFNYLMVYFCLTRSFTYPKATRIKRYNLKFKQYNIISKTLLIQE